MSHPGLSIQPIRREDIGPAVELAARAFFDDPLFVHLHPDPATRQREFAIEHEAYLRRIYLPVGVPERATVDGALAGMALWLPPGAARGLTLREWLCVPAMVRAVGPVRAWRMIREYSAFNGAFPADPHIHYLGLIAVAPDAQGRGVGAALLRAGLQRADADRAGVYLETGTEANLRFYRRHGFEVLDEIHLPTAPMHWSMWRPPQR